MDGGPQLTPETWYPVNLGSTLVGESKDRFYTMRYDFKPASVRTSTSGSVNISGDNEVTMEFHPPATGKPNLIFQGKAEPCKELEAVLLFDGEKFTIEKLARSIRSLRHIPQQSGNAGMTSSSPGMTSGGGERQGGAPVEAERIESPPREGEGVGDVDLEERGAGGKKGAKEGRKGAENQKHAPGRPSGKRKPSATDPTEHKSSKAKTIPDKEETPSEDEAPAANVEHIDEEEVVEEIIYEEEEARPVAPPRPKVSASARKTGLVESSSDSGHSSGSGSDDDSDDDDDDEDDDDDDGDDDASSGSDEDS